MAWDHLSITNSHLVYIILGGFTSLFMLCSSVIKERMYIGEATVATICGVVFGPRAANLINPFEWGNTDEVTLEFSRIVLVVQCFAVGVELPKFYMEKHWRSVVFLLVPVMAFGWLMTGVFIFLLIPTLNWLDSLVVAACVTATDPVLASSVVGKGKFARRVPKHLRDLLSAESGCNDGMAFPFVYLALYLIQFNQNTKDVSFHWIVIIILYECIFGAIYGFVVGYIARRGIMWAHEHDLIDRESFLSFYFVLSLFCAGSGSILGLDDLLVGFAAGVGFSNDGWFGEKTEESHVSNVIDLLLNLSYFVYLGTIIPWEQFNATEIGLTPWRLVAIAALVIFFRRIPIMLCLKPVIPDLKNWREALFAGHFGPIGVGAIFVAILARAELQHQDTIPLDELPDESENPNAILIKAVWPIVTFLVVASIVVHGSSVAVFTLGKRINTLSITMSYTKDMGEDGPDWLRRLPRISSQSRSQAKSMSSMEDHAPGTLPMSGFLRRKVDDGKQHSRQSSVGSKRKKSKTLDDVNGPGGPVSESAIYPQRRPHSIAVFPQRLPHNFATSPTTSPISPREDSGTPSPKAPAPVHLKSYDPEKFDLEAQASTLVESSESHTPVSKPPSHVELFEEGPHLIIEDRDGEVLAMIPSRDKQTEPDRQASGQGGTDGHISTPTEAPLWTYSGVKSRFQRFLDDEKNKRKGKDKLDRKHESAQAYQYGNTIIVEDADGEVVKRYELPPEDTDEPGSSDFVSQSLKYVGALVKSHSPADSNEPRKPTDAELEEEDDKRIRFRIGGEEGQRMRKEDFIRTVGQLAPRTRDKAPDNPTAAAQIKEIREIPAWRAPSTQPRQPATASGGAGPGPEGEDSDTTKAGSQPDTPPSPTTRPQGDMPRDRARSGSFSSAAVSNRWREFDGLSSFTAQSEEFGRPRRQTISEAVSPTQEEPRETPVEQRRRDAALAATGSSKPDPEPDETPAERRRREAALGMMGDHEDDSDDDNTERVVPSQQRRGIRWSDVPSRR